MPIRTFIQRVSPVLLLFFLVACSSSAGNAVPPTGASETRTAGVYQAISVDTFADILRQESDAYTVINVHIPYEGEIEGTDAHVAYNDPVALTKALPDKNAKIILYCRSGRMSEIATRTLLERGYMQVWDVTGGMVAWEGSGRPLKD